MTLGKYVQRYSVRGKFLGEWPSMTRAAKETKQPFWVVASCCVGIRKKDDRNCLWKFKNEPDFPEYIGKRDRRILQKTPRGRIVKRWKNARELIKKTGFRQSGIYLI